MGRGDLAALVRICDPAGRLRGTGFVADDLGTVVTSHEAVDGLPRVLLRAGERSCIAGPEGVVPLPETGLALVRTKGLGVRPLPIGTRERVEAGTYVRLPARGWREARVLGTARVTYTTSDRLHLVGEALELAIGTDGSDALRPGGGAAGGPVLDAATGAVLGVLGTALRSGSRAAGFALPLRAGSRDAGPLGALLRRNAATVPAYGHDLNLAALLELCATSVGAAGVPGSWVPPVERPHLLGEFGSFTAPVMGLVGRPGTGRTTELAALTARRAHGPEPAPTVWLRGADLHADDTSVADAVARALRQAGRIVAASGARGDMGCVTPGRVAGLAREAGRPLLIVLDGPEEMPAALAHRQADWTDNTVRWLGDCGVRMVVGCRPEHWEQAGALYPPQVLHRPLDADRALPPAVPVGDLSPDEAARLRERYGLPAGALGAADARHPLTLRLLAEVRQALPGEVPGRPSRDEVFAAHLDLTCLRIAVRIAAASRPPLRGPAVRRLAAKVSGQVNEAARHCLGPGQGQLDREAFEELFPWGAAGWASAVLAEGLLVPAGQGHRFAHEELADWLQGAHLDVDAALHSLIHRPRAPLGPPPTLPVPRHRIGPVIEALLLLDRLHGPPALARRLRQLIEALDDLDQSVPALPAHTARAMVPGEETPGAANGGSGGGLPVGAGASGPNIADASWWGARLLREVLLRLPDARPYLPVLRRLADRITRRSLREGGPRHLGGFAEFGPSFWERLRVGEEQRLDLLRRLLPADGTPTSRTGPRFLDAVDARLAGAPVVVQPLLCAWFTDETPLPADPGAGVRPTVAAAAQALLYARRDLAVDSLTEALLASAHPRADELLAALADDARSTLRRAVDRWAHDAPPGRHVAAGGYGLAMATRGTTGTDRELLR